VVDAFDQGRVVLLVLISSLHNVVVTFYSQGMVTGQVIVISSVLFFAIASYAVLLSPFLPLTGFFVCPHWSNIVSFLTLFIKKKDP
jgi:hypothetical protein